MNAWDTSFVKVFIIGYKELYSVSRRTCQLDSIGLLDLAMCAANSGVMVGSFLIQWDYRCGLSDRRPKLQSK